MKYYVVDAFTDQLFRGNPAGVCIMDQWPDSGLMQNIARENNLSETAFLVKRDGYYGLRWFTPEVEVDLCGHATLASAHILFCLYEQSLDELWFQTMSGLMTVSKKGDSLQMNFPARPPTRTRDFHALRDAFAAVYEGVYRGLDFMVVFESEAQVRSLRPDFAALKRLKDEAGADSGALGVIVTARGEDCDFVCRFFAPGAGINEDPATGRAYCTLIPYWSGILGKASMKARQLSERTGEIDCHLSGDRVLIGGKAALYLSGEIYA